MGERPDIGKMIEEELAKGGSPEASRPLEMKGDAVVESDRPAAAAETAKDGKKDIWAKERKERADALGSLHAERKANPPEKKDALSPAELDELRSLIAQAAKENEKVSTAVLKEGIAVADDATLHPYDKGLESISAKLLEPGTELYRQAVMLLNSQPDGKAAMDALMRKIPDRVMQLAKATEQKKTMYGAPKGSERPAAATSRPPEAAPAADPDQKKKAVQEAMKPFYDDVNRMLQGDKRRKEREAEAANEDKEEKDKPSLWERWFGGKKAA